MVSTRLKNISQIGSFPPGSFKNAKCLKPNLLVARFPNKMARTLSESVVTGKSPPLGPNGSVMVVSVAIHKKPSLAWSSGKAHQILANHVNNSHMKPNLRPAWMTWKFAHRDRHFPCIFHCSISMVPPMAFPTPIGPARGKLGIARHRYVWTSQRRWIFRIPRYMSPSARKKWWDKNGDIYTPED